MTDRRDVSFELAVRWLQGWVGQHVAFACGYDENEPSIISEGTLTLMEGMDLDEVRTRRQDPVFFRVGKRRGGGMVFCLSHARFQAASIIDIGDGDELMVMEGPLIFRVRPAQTPS